MDRLPKFPTLSVVLLLALVPTACSSTGTTKMQVSSMCERSGGTYAAGSCQPASKPLTAAQLCSAHGGTYHAGGDYCEVENSMFWK
jgi:hypothetical protein